MSENILDLKVAKVDKACRQILTVLGKYRNDLPFKITGSYMHIGGSYEGTWNYEYAKFYLEYDERLRDFMPIFKDDGELNLNSYFHFVCSTTNAETIFIQVKEGKLKAQVILKNKPHFDLDGVEDSFSIIAANPKATRELQKLAKHLEIELSKTMNMYKEAYKK